MKRPLLLPGLLALLLAGSAPGDVASRMKEKARGFRELDRTGEGQPAKAPAPPPPPAPVAAKPVAPAFTAAHLESAKKLVETLNAIKPKTTATADQVRAVTQSVTGAAQAASKPLPNNLAKLAADLASAWPYQKLDAREKEQLAKNIVALLNGPAACAGDPQKALQGSEVILKYSGLPAAEAQKIMASLKAAAAQVSP